MSVKTIIFHTLNTIYILSGFSLMYFSHNLIDQCQDSLPICYLFCSIFLAGLVGYYEGNFSWQKKCCIKIIYFIYGFEATLIGWGIQSLSDQCLDPTDDLPVKIYIGFSLFYQGFLFLFYHNYQYRRQQIKERLNNSPLNSRLSQYEEL